MEIYERIASGFSFYADKGRYLDAVNRNGKFYNGILKLEDVN